ncbi:MAG: molybdenum cofactor guanylyltransferase [Candidatus Bathyarchaeia archaeon]
MLAGGLGERFGGNKALAALDGKTMLRHILDRIISVAEEKAIVIRDSYKLADYQPHVPKAVRILKDSQPSRGPLVGIVTGLSHLSSTYVCVLSCDLPLVNPNAIKHLFEVVQRRDAAVPVCPNGRIEALHAVYRRRTALKACGDALIAGELSNKDMIKRLKLVAYVPVADFKRYDPKLLTFRNVNTHRDLTDARSILGSMEKAKGTMLGEPRFI